MGAILVSGGAGYIDSHVVKAIGETGREVVSLDNLSKGFREAVQYGDLIVGSTQDAALVRALLGDYGVDTVMHFAALTIVPESVSSPLRYYGNNTCGTRTLLECCAEPEPALDDLDVIAESSLSWERNLERLRAQGKWQRQPA